MIINIKEYELTSNMKTIVNLNSNWIVKTLIKIMGKRNRDSETNTTIETGSPTITLLLAIVLDIELIDKKHINIG